MERWGDRVGAAWERERVVEEVMQMPIGEQVIKDKRRGVIHGRTSFGVNRNSVAAKVCQLRGVLEVKRQGRVSVVRDGSILVIP